jgi:hypothetical protein
MKTSRTILAIVPCLILFFSNCPKKEESPDYKYILVTSNLNLEAVINTHPAAGEFIEYSLRDPDPGADMGIALYDHTDYQGKYSVSGSKIKLYKGRRIESRISLYYYKDDPDIIGNVYDNEILDWDAAVESASPEIDGTATYTWNVTGNINIKTTDYGVETSDYVITWVKATFLVKERTSETETKPVSGQTVRAKIYDDRGTVRDLTLTTDSEGSTSETYLNFNLSKGEYLTVSAFLKDHADIYETKVLSYSDAFNNAQETREDGRKVYTWKITITLYTKY